jgi:hypothetical protein
MGAYSFFRTVAGLTAAATFGALHGLGLIPDYVVVEYRGTPGSVSTAVNIFSSVDSLGVTLSMGGVGSSPNLKIAVIHAHSIVT